VPGLGASRIELDGPADEVEGIVEFASLAGDHAEEAEGVGVVGVVGEDITVDLGGFVEAASEVVVESLAE
jgi:hypothetical protein